MATVIDAGARLIHVDVMDGHFVPNITIGPLVVKAIAPLAHERGAALDVHLMIEHPERYVEAFAAAGADAITVHQEACVHLHRTLAQIREAGARAGVALNPATPLETSRRGARSRRPRARHVGQPRLRRAALHRGLARQAAPRSRLPAGGRRARGRRRRVARQRGRPRRRPAPTCWWPATASTGRPTRRTPSASSPRPWPPPRRRQPPAGAQAAALDSRARPVAAAGRPAERRRRARRRPLFAAGTTMRYT